VRRGAAGRARRGEGREGTTVGLDEKPGCEFRSPRRVEIGIVGDLVVSRVAATMALPKGPPWKEGGGKLEGKRERKRGGESWERDGGRRGKEHQQKGTSTEREAERGRRTSPG